MQIFNTAFTTQTYNSSATIIHTAGAKETHRSAMSYLYHKPSFDSVFVYLPTI